MDTKTDTLPQNGTDSWLTVTPSGSTFPTTLTFTMKSVPTIGTVGSISLVNPSDQTIEPQTITIQVGTPVTVDSSTAGLSITVDGNNVTTPQFFLWVPGSTHQITAPNTQPGLSNGTMAAFQSWTGYPFTNGSLTVPTNGAEVRAQYIIGYPLTVKIVTDGGVIGTIGGTVSADSASTFGIYSVGQPVNLTPVSSTGYVFEGFTGVSGKLNPNGSIPVVMTGPENVTVTFQPSSAAGQTTIRSTPEGIPFTVDTAANAVTPAAFAFGALFQTIAVPGSYSPAAGTRYLFQNWDDGTVSATRLINDPTGVPQAFTALYQTQFLLTVTPGVGGSITASPTSPDGYYSQGASVTLTLTPANGYVCTGIGSNTGLSVQLTISSAVSLGPACQTLASFGQTTLDTGWAIPLTVDGTNYNTPSTFNWGLTQHTVTAPATYFFPGQPGIRYVFLYWADNNANLTRIIAGQAGSLTYNARYRQDLQLTTVISPAGAGSVSVTPSSPDGLYTTASPVTITATPAVGYNFLDLLSNGNRGSSPGYYLLATAPLQVTAEFGGTPNLYASAGGRSDGQVAGTRNVPINLNNTGTGAAVNAQIDSITAISDVGGTGTVSVVTPFPAVVGTVAPGGVGNLGLIFDWPTTATRVQFTVNYSSGGGSYKNSSTLTILR